MAHFIGFTSGTTKPVSRLGTKASGITSSCSGWNIGAKISIEHKNGVDIVSIYQTGGSNNSEELKKIIEFTEELK